MIAELGHFSLAIAFAFSLLLAIVPIWGAYKGHGGQMSLARPLTYGMFVFTLISYIALTWGFLVADFSIAYVASNSSSALPWYYRITAVWSSHEGSFLLWMLVQAGWAAALAVYSTRLPLTFAARVLAVMGMIGVGFYLFMLLTSNPFDRLIPFIPVDGRDMNPLLQDPGMIIHPPLLYFGYVGLSVAFAFAIAALLGGRLDSAWARWSRPWTLAAWIFLTLGIMVGSWWAYYELGWGGWWFWDPVENASFMPWLVATALIHSLAVTEKRGTFKSWTVLLAISGFSLSLLGTFLVRSGVLVSVHAFAADPTRGMFLLAFLAIVICSSLLLYAIRASKVVSHTRYELFSREVLLLGNNLFLVTATMVVLLGTLLPLIHQQLGLGSISIGEPFFNSVFVYITIPFAILLGIGPLVRWRRQGFKELITPLATALMSAVILASLLPKIIADEVHGMAVLGLLLALWIVASTVQELRQRVAKRENKPEALVKLGRSHWGMVLGHLGFAVAIIGIALVQNYEVERTVRMSPGDTFAESGYEFRFTELGERQGPNFVSEVATFEITRNGRLIDTVDSEKRFYTIQRQVMTQTALQVNPFRDLYIAMGEELNDGSWAVRIHIKPFVRWIWMGGVIMALGGLLSASDKRYRLKKKSVGASAQGASA
ncbi:MULTISPECIES: heme lyase CcmF/NrfE family subunit [Gammaproteobacteria]|uniref:heme lyase CcmF/NrfE family subunit n=1 Tax=Gammaproteobacteria TaxID=1236 RepID=UPI000DD07AD0|nr:MULTISPECIES: heme lyase CcmF/NrfE family subunit [Gammaproteobacteria]RTE86113.1 heme lyase CcmF/NrfE family subunit [Aliidiomarina sp. B3213]TCZ91466.1 heme lyase CcmF/NrfE family subunit [Lysobacter sp. N42]